MSFFKKKGVGLADIIRCDEPSYLIWKWRPLGAPNGKATVRENAIRWGSVVRVKDGEVAVFVYRQKSGIMQDFIVGPFDEKLHTKNLPILSSILGLAYRGDTPFQAEIYFINLAEIIQIKFAVPFFDIYDPRFADFGIPVSARGTLSFQIKDYEEFIKLHRLISFDLEQFKEQVKGAICRYAKAHIASAPSFYGISALQIESKIGEINTLLEKDLTTRLEEDFGVAVSGVDISAIEIDKSSEGYTKLLEVTRDLSAQISKAKAEAGVKDIHDKQRIEAENYEEELRIKRETEEYAKRKETESANLEAFRIEKNTEVGVAGAEALGKMGDSSVSVGDGATGFSPASMMASIAVGGVVGKSIADTMGASMSGMTSSVPPVPSNTYFVAIAGTATGPFEISALKEMVKLGTLRTDSLVWKQGMSDWIKADSVSELSSLFSAPPTPPPLP